jgi:hypothetical protein
VELGRLDAGFAIVARERLNEAQRRCYAARLVDSVAQRDLTASPYRWVGFGASPEVACQLLRDIFGNPFRPVTLHSDWRTDTVIALASMMYESREFSAMPILADALQDAGCDNDALLAHCRDANQPHVRGC